MLLPSCWFLQSRLTRALCIALVLYILFSQSGPVISLCSADRLRYDLDIVQICGMLKGVPRLREVSSWSLGYNYYCMKAYHTLWVNFTWSNQFRDYCCIQCNWCFVKVFNAPIKNRKIGSYRVTFRLSRLLLFD